MASVAVIGAGAAGLTAAYTLKNAGLPVKVLEANSNQIGGRIRKDITWDFPIDIGAEWIHTNPSILEKIVGHELPPPNVILQNVNLQMWEGSEFTSEKPYNDYKWVNTTWWDFFNDHLASFLEEDIVLGCVVNKINYTEAPLVISCDNGNTYEADYVIVTASMKVLQDNLIRFVPELPEEYSKVLNQFEMEPAVKIFVEFKDKFYPSLWETYADYYKYSSDGQSANYYDRCFYDACFGQNTTANIVGVFAFARTADQYVNEASDGDSLMADLLAELDQMFEGKASELYVKHIVQSWPADPYTRTGYTRYVKDDPYPIQVFQKPVDSKLLFAGEALPVDLENWGYAHGAALSGQEAAYKILALNPTTTRPPSSVRAVDCFGLSSVIASILVLMMIF